MILTNKSFLYLLVFATFVFSLQLLINLIVPIEILDFKKILKIHGFVFLITTIVIAVTNRVSDKTPDKTGFVYLGFVLFKMITSVVFLFPFFSLPLPQAKVVVVNFFMVFLIYIVFEAKTVVTYLNNKQQK